MKNGFKEDNYCPKNEKMSGGRADGKSPKDFPRMAIADGMKVEMEHTDDRNIAVEIVMDHLIEDIDYYKKLKKIHKNSIDIFHERKLKRGISRYGK